MGGRPGPVSRRAHRENSFGDGGEFLQTPGEAPRNPAYRMKKLWRLYGLALESSPVRTQMASSAVIWAGGDLSAQLIEQKLEQKLAAHSNSRIRKALDGAAGSSLPLAIDWRRTGVQTGYAGLVWAPGAHVWYSTLDRIAYSVARAGTHRFVAAKLTLEMVALHPVSLAAFFGFVGIAQREPLGDVARQIRRDLPPSLALEWAMWLPLDAANFAWVPVRHQLLVVNCGCFLESIALSFVKANGFALPAV